MRSGRQKFDAHALPFIGGFAEIYDAAFLFFLREGIGEDEHGIEHERLVQVDQAAVSADDNGFAGFAEALAIRIFSRGHDADAQEDSSATASSAEGLFRHGKTMLRHFRYSVNARIKGLFPYS